MRTHYFNTATKRHMQRNNIKRNALKTIEALAWTAALITVYVALLALNV